MLGTLCMDIDTCIQEYKAMSPEIFPIGYLSSSKAAKFINTVTGTPRFDPAPFEKAVKRLVVKQMKDNLPADTEGSTISQEPQVGSTTTEDTQDTVHKNKKTPFKWLKTHLGKSERKGNVTLQHGQTNQDAKLENTPLRYNASRDHKSPECKV